MAPIRPSAAATTRSLCLPAARQKRSQTNFSLRLTPRRGRKVQPRLASLPRLGQGSLWQKDLQARVHRSLQENTSTVQGILGVLPNRRRHSTSWPAWGNCCQAKRHKYISLGGGNSADLQWQEAGGRRLRPQGREGITPPVCRCRWRQRQLRGTR